MPFVCVCECVQEEEKKIGNGKKERICLNRSEMGRREKIYGNELRRGKVRSDGINKNSQ